VHFSAADGRIWLSGQRMLRVHATSLASLRRELLSTIGSELTRQLLLQAGAMSNSRARCGRTRLSSKPSQ